MSAEAMQTAASFVQQLAGDLNNGNLELPMFPDSVIRIQQVFRAEEVDVDEVVKIISSDPALVARILQIANSSAVRGNVEIVRLRQAVIRIGNKLVQSSAIAFAISQAEKNADLSDEAKAIFKDIWAESVELAAHCHVIAKHYTKLNADESLLAGLLSVLGRLYIFMKSQDCGITNLAELEAVVASWHPAISKAIAEEWNMSEELVNALETQLDTNPELKESATLAEVLSASRLIYEHAKAGEDLQASEYPLLQRLGIADHGEESVTLEEHAEALEAIRQSLKG